MSIRSVDNNVALTNKPTEEAEVASSVDGHLTCPCGTDDGFVVRFSDECVDGQFRIGLSERCKDWSYFC